MSATTPHYVRVLRQGEMPDRVLVRITEVELLDAHGVLRPSRIIETSSVDDKDALGAQRWHKLTLHKGGAADWARLAEWCLDELFKE